MNRLIILLVAMAAVVAGSPMLCGIVRLQAENPNSANVTGDLTLIQSSKGAPVKIQGKIFGLTSGLHGFHIHEKGDLRGGCNSAGAHFNPNKVNHGGPNSDVRHVGDLGNIVANDKGVADINIMDNIISLSGPNNVIGRAIVVHANEDNLGEGHDEDSLKTGNAGARVACGIIGVLKMPDTA